MPNSAQPYQGGTVQFSVAVRNASSSAVVWQVNQITGGNPIVGTVDSTGLYRAPASVPNPPTVMVSASLQSDSTKTGSSNVTILSLSSVTGQLVVSPALSSVTTSQSLQFQILTPGVTNTDVNWSTNGGTITPAGAYTPPSIAGAYTVLASLPNATGSATVEVTDFAGNFTWRNDNSRSGVNSRELAHSPQTVNSSSFGMIFKCQVDGYVYAQPLYVPNLTIPGMRTHNVIFVATEKDSVFAFDADTKPCIQLWRADLVPPGDQPVISPPLPPPSPPLPGITGTPVIGMSTSALYAVAWTQDEATGSVYHHTLYALDLTTGQAEIQPAGVRIITPDSVFSSFVDGQQAALLLDNGTVYVAFGSNGIPGDYHGWLLAYDASTLQQTGVFDSTRLPSVQGGISQSGGGPSADANGSIYAVTGDGPFNADQNGYSYGDSFLRIGTSAGGTLSVEDYFTPCDLKALQTAGLDVGTSAPVLLPDSAGSPAQPHLLIGGSEAGSLYVVNRDNMGKFTPAPPPPPACSDSSAGVQTIHVPGGPILSTPLFWNNSVYVVPGNGNVLSFPMTAGILASSPSAANLNETLGPQGATPVISSNGTNNAILWLVDTSGALAAPNSPAVLRAYDANNLANEIYNSSMAAASRDKAGLAVKFTVPTVANGKVYVGTQTELDVYGLL